jgi:hypothetical protein
MTALKKYQKLESSGLWRDAPEAQRREVVVAFGEASLVLTDQRTGSALSHWSLAAVHRLNPGNSPALYAPDAAAQAETLELEDATMIGAIETVRGAIANARPRPGRLRGALLAGGALALGLLSMLWLPPALIAQTAGMVPSSTRVEIGRMVLADLTRLTGLPCTAPLGQHAADHLAARVLGQGGGPILVVRDGVAGAIALPGGFVLLSRNLVERQDGPDAAAGYVLAEKLRSSVDDPLVPVLEHAGMIATLRLLTSGTLPDSSVAGYAETLLRTPQRSLDDEGLLAAFEMASLASTPYAYAVDPSGETVLGLIEADPFRGKTSPAVLPDEDWVSLQGICDGG